MFGIRRFFVFRVWRVYSRSLVAPRGHCLNQSVRFMFMEFSDAA